MARWRRFLHSFLPFLVVWMIMYATVPVSSQALPGCQAKCGNVDIRYPFGIGDGCFRSGFDLTCENSKPFYGGFGVQEIMIPESQVRVDMPAGQYCFTSDGKPRTEITRFFAQLSPPFSFSTERNAFTVIGCDTLVRFGDPSKEFMTGCVSVCNNRSRIENGTCTGVGCCQTAIPEGLLYFEGVMSTFNNYSGIRDFSRCSYAFLVEKKLFHFNTTILTTEYNYGDLRPPMILDWVVEDNKTCLEAKTNLTAYGCRSSNSVCNYSDVRKGYYCNCSEGYEGNPYIEKGCQDIDECRKPELYPCNGLCTNTPGGYNCACPPGKNGNNPKQEKCIDDPVSAAGSSLPVAVKVIIGLGSSFLFFMVVASWVYWGCQKRRLIKLKQAFFEQNGGFFLQQQLAYHQASSFKIFTMYELRKATENFDQKQIIGKGAHGTVYRGVLDDGWVVAIKKSMVVDDSKSREFAKEMLILSQINHVHIVKLLGCCLEVEVPMLVYEYIPNGTLFQFIHQGRREFFISFQTRIRIATETAESLSYLHSAASPPILHGDVKSSNILLDHNHRVKVSDFGTSVLALDDKTQFTTLVQGTCGYLDPEYLQTCQLTEKSDVYSFGVVLVELLTGRKALSFGGAEEERSLAFNFVLCESKNRLLEILDPQIIREDGLSKPVLDAARIAVQCLSLKGDDRPTMKQVILELQASCRTENHPWVNDNPEEKSSLLGDEPTPSGGNESIHNLTTGTERHAILEMVELGR